MLQRDEADGSAPAVLSDFGDGTPRPEPVEGEELVAVELVEGSSFGEQAMLGVQDPRVEVTFVAMHYAEVYSLNNSDLRKLFAQHPRQEAVLKTIFADRQADFVHIDDK